MRICDFTCTPYLSLIHISGGYGRTVADVAGQTGEYSKILFLDDNSAAPDVIGKCAEYECFRDAQTALYPALDVYKRQA